jgi:GNAT superfamily N-acetyltransferase
LPHIFDTDNSYQHSLLDAAFGPPLPKGSPFRSLILVANDGDDLLGYVFVIWDGTQPEGATALIADIAIAERVQGKGIGKMLLRDLHGQMKDQGWASLRADVWQGNTASHALFSGAEYATERVTYRFGTPSAQHVAPPEPPQTTSTHFWWIAIAFLVAIAIVASAP